MWCGRLVEAEEQANDLHELGVLCGGAQLEVWGLAMRLQVLTLRGDPALATELAARYEEVAAGLVDEIVGGGGEATFRVDRPQDAASLLRSVEGVEGVEVDGDQVHADLDGLPRAEALAKLVGAGVAVSQAGPRRRLEDAFLALVGESP